MNIFSFFYNHPGRIGLVSLTFIILAIVFFFVVYLKDKQILPIWPTLILAYCWLCLAILQYYSLTKYIRINQILVLPFIFGLTVGLLITQITLLVFKPKEQSQMA